MRYTVLLLRQIPFPVHLSSDTLPMITKAVVLSGVVCVGFIVKDNLIFVFCFHNNSLYEFICLPEVYFPVSCLFVLEDSSGSICELVNSHVFTVKNSRILYHSSNTLPLPIIINRQVAMCNITHIVLSVATMSASLSSAKALFPIALHQYFHIVFNDMYQTMPLPVHTLRRNQVVIV